MDRNMHDYGGLGWPQGPSDPIHQRHPPSGRYEGYFGETYDKFGVEDSWRSHPSDSWRDDRLSRFGDLPPRFDGPEYHGWRRSISPDRPRAFPKDQFTYVRAQEPKMPRLEMHSKPRGRGRHRRSLDRPPSHRSEKDVVKSKLEDSDTKDRAKGIAEAEPEKDFDENTEKKMSDDDEEKECQSTTAKKEENCEQQQTDVAAKEEVSAEKSADIKPIEQNEKKEVNGSKEGEDPSKKLIIRKDFTHDDIHHFKPISIREPEEKLQTKRRRELGWVAQWEMKNAAIKESTRSGSGSKANSIPDDLENPRIRKDSSNESDDKPLPKGNPILHGPVLDPQEYVEELSNPDLTDPPQVEDLASELMPKRKKANSSTEEDWRPGAKTSLLGPPPPEIRRGEASDAYRPPKPGLLGRPPPKIYFEDTGPRRPPKPGLLDGPRREPPPGPRSFPYNEEYGPPAARFRAGPSANAGNEALSEKLVMAAASSLTGSDVISEVAKKGIAELLLSSETLKAKIAEAYSEEIKKMLKGPKAEESPSTARVGDRGSDSSFFGPRSGKALLGAPPGRGRDGPPGHLEVPPVKPPVMPPDDRVSFFNRSSNALWKENYERPRVTAYEEPAEYYREGPSQGWRDSPHNPDTREYRQQYLSERERHMGPGQGGQWEDYRTGERGNPKEWGRERRDPREYEDYLESYGKVPYPREPYTNSIPDTRRSYGPSERYGDRDWEYGDSGFGPAGKGAFDAPREVYRERRQ